MKKITLTQLESHIISAVITFAAAFAAEMLWVIDTITPETVQNGALWAIVFVAVRAGLKAVLQWFVGLYSEYKH